jgi:hypothetical protein
LRLGTLSSVSWVRGLDLVEDGVDERRVLGQPLVGVGVLGLEVGERVGIVAVGQPRPRIVHGTGRTVPGVGDALGDGRLEHGGSVVTAG